MMKQKKKGYQGIGAIYKVFEYEKDVTSNVAITMKNEKQCQTRAIIIYQGSTGHFQIKLPDIDCFTDKLMQCSSCKKYFRK